MTPMVALATTAFAWIVFTVVLVGFLIYAALNQRAARKELGSEIELAPNRKPYYNDEELEGKRLELVQLVGVLLLVVIVIALPLYWVLEPIRQAGAKEQAADTLAGWGENLFRPTAEGGFNCAGCHGGMNATGGNAPGTVTDPPPVRSARSRSSPRRSTPCSIASPPTRCATSSPTGARAPRCRRGASTAAGR